MGANGHNGHNNGGAGLFGMPQNDVPIVGQPFTMKAWFVTMSLKCNCGAHEPLLVVGQLGARAKCPACQKVYVLQSLKTEGARINFNMAVAVDMSPQQPPETPNA